MNNLEQKARVAVIALALFVLAAFAVPIVLNYFGVAEIVRLDHTAPSSRVFPEGCDHNYSSYLVPYDCLPDNEKLFWDNRASEQEETLDLEILE